jgi:hypothetical protein
LTPPVGEGSFGRKRMTVTRETAPIYAKCRQDGIWMSKSGTNRKIDIWSEINKSELI